MCTTKRYTKVYHDGHRGESYRYELCNEARLGLPCLETTSSSRSRTTQPPYAYSDTYLPPTPSYTPVTSTPVYRSGDDSDRSYHSSSSTGRRRSGRYYVTDNQYLEVNRRSYRPAHRESGRRGAERVVIVDGPPTPRTPPQTYASSHSAPSSPNFTKSVPHVVEPSYRRDSARLRPIIVDERPRPRVHIVEPSPERPSKSHTRVPSADKTKTTAPSTSKEQDRLDKQREERDQQQAISPSFDSTAGVTDPFARMDLNRDQRREDRARRREEKAEQEAMDRRLRERLMPRRRATVGPGTRRHPILYDDNVYRWE
ncbi:hypothetical protein LIA77_05104 [Sarocladium implicatum]|nr:hypothetical protein LIA77_05104 [Sarocladium implicatum]